MTYFFRRLAGLDGFAFLELGGGGVFSIRRSASSSFIPWSETADCRVIIELNHTKQNPASLN